MSLFPQIPRIANSSDLGIMSEALEGYCFRHDIADQTVRADIARLVLMLFENGAKTVDDLTEALDQSRSF
jgi:hypothetical protein